MPLALGVLLGEDMARKRVAALDAAAGALPEALGSGLLGLQLGHDNDSCFSLAPGACTQQDFGNPDNYFLGTTYSLLPASASAAALVAAAFAPGAFFGAA